MKTILIEHPDGVALYFHKSGGNQVAVMFVEYSTREDVEFAGRDYLDLADGTDYFTENGKVVVQCFGTDKILVSIPAGVDSKFIEQAKGVASSYACKFLKTEIRTDLHEPS